MQHRNNTENELKVMLFYKIDLSSRELSATLSVYDKVIDFKYQISTSLFFLFS